LIKLELVIDTHKFVLLSVKFSLCPFN